MTARGADPALLAANALEGTVRYGVAGAFSLSAAALATASLGWFHPVTSLVGGTVGTLALARLWPKVSPSRGLRSWPAVILALAIGLTWLNATHASEQLFGGRDDGTYINTAISIAERGSIPIPVDHDSRFPESSRAESPGFPETREGILSPQFFHAYPALLAVGIGLLGVEAAAGINAFLGGIVLACFGAICLARMRPFLAVLATAGLGLTLPFIYFSRAHFSEPLMMVGIFGALVALDVVDASHRRRGASLACGLVLGGAVMARLDGLLLVIPVAALIGVGRDSALGLDIRWLSRGFFAVVALTIVETSVHSPAYIGGRALEVVAIAAAGIGAMVISGLWVSSAWQPLRAAAYRHRRPIATAVLAVAGAVLVWTVGIRPACCPAATDQPNSWVAAAAVNEGISFDPERSYAEMVPRSLVWYLGVPATVAAVVGLSLAIWRTLQGHQRDAAILAIATVFAGYLWRPAITADQIWASRRLLPVLIPVALILAATALEVAWLRLPKGGWLLGPVAALVLLGGALTSLPLLDFKEHRGLVQAFEQACDQIGNRPVLVVEAPGDPTGQFLSQPLRGLCRVPVGTVSLGDLSPDETTGFVVVARKVDTLGVIAGGNSTRPLIDISVPFVEPTLTGPPGRVITSEFRFYMDDN